MDRAEKTGLALALAGHAALVALLSLRLAVPPPPPSTEHPIEVSLVDEVGLKQTAPPAPAPPSVSEAPEQGAPAEAAAPAEPDPAPKPLPRTAPPPPAPKPQPAPKPAPVEPPKPRPVERPARPEAAKPAPAKPAPTKPAPTKPAPAKPAPTKPVEKSAPAKPAPRPAAARPSARPDAGRLAGIVADAERAAARSARAGEGSSAAGTAPRARGSRLGADFLKGLSATPSKAAASTAAPGATMNGKALADIGSAILRQVQPCADRQVNPGPGAERIRVAINLKLNRDGSLAAPPRVVNHDGVDTENRRYLDRVDDLAIATFSGCAPLRGLPADLYDVPNGWRSFTLRYKLPG